MRFVERSIAFYVVVMWMKRKKFVCLLVSVLFCVMCFLTGCSEEPDIAGLNRTQDFVKIEGNRNLYYNKNTKIVYYIYQGHEIDWDYHCSYMSPYIAANGLPYIYQDGELRMIQQQ